MGTSGQNISNDLPNEQKKALLGVFNTWWFWSFLFGGLGILFLWFAGRTLNRLDALSDAYATLKDVPGELKTVRSEVVAARIESAKLNSVPEQITKLSSSSEKTREELTSIKSKTDTISSVSTKADEISAQVATTSLAIKEQAKTLQEQQKTAKSIDDNIKKLSADLKDIDRKVSEFKPGIPTTRRVQVRVRIPEKQSGEEGGFVKYNCDIPRLDATSAGTVERFEFNETKDTPLPQYIAKVELSSDGKALVVLVKTEKQNEFQKALAAGIDVSASIAFQ